MKTMQHKIIQYVGLGVHNEVKPLQKIAEIFEFDENLIVLTTLRLFSLLTNAQRTAAWTRPEPRSC